jgi:osmotically-inducible protein OsmY
MKNNANLPLNTRKDLQWGPCIKEMPEKMQAGYSVILKESDEDIARRASNALKWNISVPSHCINVRVKNGVVTLSGEISWEYQNFAAEEAVRYTSGAVLIDNLITIKPDIYSRY